jgi:predicted transcriptional regulator
MPRQIAARVPDESHRRLKALAVVLNTSQADVLTRALSALEQTLLPRQRRIVRMLVGKKG